MVDNIARGMAANVLKKFNNIIVDPANPGTIIYNNKEHDKLQNLDFASSGHVGFQPSTDSNLLTKDKSISGAINELHNKVFNILSVIDGGNPSTVSSKTIDGGNPSTVATSIIEGGTIV